MYKYHYQRKKDMTVEVGKVEMLLVPFIRLGHHYVASYTCRGVHSFFKLPICFCTVYSLGIDGNGNQLSNQERTENRFTH